MKAINSILLWLFLGSLGFAQPELATALVQRSDLSTGSCVVIERLGEMNGGFRGLAVTAYHVVEGTAGVRVVYARGGAALECHTLAFDKDADLAIIDVWFPSYVEPVELADIVDKRDVLLVGYPMGGYDTLRGRLLRWFPPNVYADINVRPGFSGGGMFDGDRLVGCISGGSFWIKDDEGRTATWPTRAGSVFDIRRLLEAARNARNP